MKSEKLNVLRITDYGLRAGMKRGGAQNMSVITFDAVEKSILIIRGIQVILDSDVAELYGVETRDINKAVKNNPGKFPAGYIIPETNRDFFQFFCA